MSQLPPSESIADAPAAVAAKPRAEFLVRMVTILVVLLAVATLALTARTRNQAFSTPLTEDGFYSLAVARNVAAGVGITIDGRLPTNGFQPLFTAVEAGAFVLARNNEDVAIRIVLAISWAIWLGAGLVVGRIAHDAGGGDATQRRVRQAIATALYLGGFLTFMHHFNGLETGLLVLGYALLWRWHQIGGPERTSPIVTGALLGLLVLTRIDAAVFVVCYCAWTALKDLRTHPVRAIMNAALTGIAALIVSSPWWAYNYAEFGAFMPTSGTAQQAWAFDERRIRWVFWALGVDTLPTLWLGRFDEIFHDGILLSVLRAAVVAMLGWIGWQAWHRRGSIEFTGDTADHRARRTLEFAGVLGAALLLLAVYYGWSFIAYWFYYRYLFPSVLLATVAIAWIAAPVAARAPRRAAAILAVLALPTLISAGMAQQGRTLHVETVYWQQLGLIERHVPASEAVAAGQAGTLGYFRDQVVNVDGKVNLEVVHQQDRMWEYLASRDVRWFCDWPFYVEKYLGAHPEQHGWRLVEQNGPWQLWHRDVAIGSGSKTFGKPRG